MSRITEPRTPNAEPAAPSERGRRHHRVFRRFECWEGMAPAGFWVNFLGVKTATKFLWTGHPPPSRPRFLKTDYPPFEEKPPQFSPGPEAEFEWIDQPYEYLEWIDVLDSVARAKEHFTMIELGAGWGRWIANAAAALQLSNPLPYTLIAAEPEPTHFQWMKEHLRNNDVDLACCHLIEAAVADKEGTIGFYTGTTSWGGPADWYGQAIGGPTLVKSVTLKSILDSVARPVDLLDMDVQGAEWMVLEAAAAALDEKVRRVHTATHSQEIEAGLRRLFEDLGWASHRDITLQSQTQTAWGQIRFQDGLQSWINAKLFDAPTIVELTDGRTDMSE